jgi:phosphoribosylglycinamide formyltransferase 1
MGTQTGVSAQPHDSGRGKRILPAQFDGVSAWSFLLSKIALAMLIPPAKKGYGPFSNRRLGVLISGRGSNLQSIVDATRDGALDADVAIVISNRAEAPGLLRARDTGLEAVCLSPGAYADRDAYDSALVDLLRARGVALVCLAGFMRLIGRPLLDAFPNRILNIHPSLLPAFPGLDAQRQALDHGVRVTGATVHLVDGDLDAGPIVLQSAVPVLDDDTVETLSARILIEEHRLYPAAIQRMLDGGWIVQGRRLVPVKTADARE